MIPAAKEAQAGRWEEQGQPRLQTEFKASLGSFVETMSQQSKKEIWGCSSGFEHLASMCEGPDSIPSSPSEKGGEG